MLAKSVHGGELAFAPRRIKRMVGENELDTMKRMIDAENSDLYDVLAYIAFALPPISREERVARRRAVILSRYDDKLQQFLDFVLGEYVREGVQEFDQDKLTPLLDLKYRSVTDAVRVLGGIQTIREAFIGFQSFLYANNGR